MSATDDAIQSILATYEQSHISHIPQRRSICCCGNEACAYLNHNQNALEELEDDVRTAAKLGQALLMRHEAYIADSENERRAMTVRIDILEAEKIQLEQMNATVIEENRSLLDQLESVNNAVTDSDAHVNSLQTTLQSTQQELQKLSHLATRAESLEGQLAEFEKEQAMWQSSLEAREESEKSAMRRWQKSERTLAGLQEQIERIERESREEKERHLEVVARIERKHAVERELTSAAGRLKGAAAARTSTGDAGGPNIVSHFVKDILQDNANLQAGIVELRDMLQNSNDEVEILRKQLLEHQPAIDEAEAGQSTIKRKDLSEELHRTTSSELHVHHHYHAPPAVAQTLALRRTKKKRYDVLIPGRFTPPSGGSTPRSSISSSTPMSLATILQQTAACVPHSVPVPVPKRVSIQSSAASQSILSSSGPASPQSITNRTSSIYERVFSDGDLDSSRPMTPETEDSGSPPLVPVGSKSVSGSTFRTYNMPSLQRRGLSPSTGYAMPTLDSIIDNSTEQLPPPAIPPTDNRAIPEEIEAEWENAESPAADRLGSSIGSPFKDDHVEAMREMIPYKPTLRRAASHESLLSISGMDIQTLSSRPSQLMPAYAGRSFTSQAVVSDAHAHAARPAAISRPMDNRHSLLSGMAADQRARTGEPALRKRVSGWMFGRWGATPITATSESVTMPPKHPSRSSTSELPSPEEQMTSPRPKPRAPGVNQSGSVLGFAPSVKQQHLPVMNSLDEEALKRALDAE